MIKFKNPFRTQGNKEVLPRHSTLNAPHFFPPAPYAVGEYDPEGTRHGNPTASRNNSIASTIDGKAMRRFSIASYGTFHRPPPQHRLPPIFHVHHAERQIAAAVTTTESAMNVSKPLNHLLDVIGDHLESPGHDDEGWGRKVINHFIDVNRLVQLHAVDAEEEEKFRKLTTKGKHHQKPIIGVDLRTVCCYAGTPTLLEGYPFMLPTILFACIEQLLHRGLADPNLFAKDPPQFSNRTITMIDNFSDISAKYGDGNYAAVNTASVADICHLLRYYLHTLPSAPLEMVVFRAIADLCVIPSSKERRTREAMGIELSEAENLYDEEYRIVLAKLILRLLPRANFDAFAYITTFLYQVYRSGVQGYTPQGLAVLFGQLVCCPRDELNYLENEHTFPQDVDWKNGMWMLRSPAKVFLGSIATDTLEWFLHHWQYIAEGLFKEDYEEDVSQFQEMVAQKIITHREQPAQDLDISDASRPWELPKEERSESASTLVNRQALGQATVNRTLVGILRYPPSPKSLDTRIPSCSDSDDEYTDILSESEADIGVSTGHLSDASFPPRSAPIVSDHPPSHRESRQSDVTAFDPSPIQADAKLDKSQTKDLGYDLNLDAPISWDAAIDQFQRVMVSEGRKLSAEPNARMGLVKMGLKTSEIEAGPQVQAQSAEVKSVEEAVPNNQGAYPRPLLLPSRLSGLRASYSMTPGDHANSSSPPLDTNISPLTTPGEELHRRLEVEAQPVGFPFPPVSEDEHVRHRSVSTSVAPLKLRARKTTASSSASVGYKDAVIKQQAEALAASRARNQRGDAELLSMKRLFQKTEEAAREGVKYRAMYERLHRRLSMGQGVEDLRPEALVDQYHVPGQLSS